MILFAHLLNDRTGSPRVLKCVIEGFQDTEPAILFIGCDGDGLLSGAPVRRVTYWYWRTGNRWLTLITFLVSQFALFWRLVRTNPVPRDAVIYVNTLLPFGAAIYGWVTGRPVVYHIHEISLSPRLFQSFLTSIAKFTAKRLIYVSSAHRDILPIAPERSVVIHNSIDPALAEAARAHVYRPRTASLFTVLMLASGRAYKGVGEFIALARSLETRADIRFELILSDGGDARDFGAIPANVVQGPPTDDPSEYYRRASLVLNLSRPDLWIETFGLTLLEAMAFGVPVIAPPVGGPTELVIDGKDGYLIDSRDGAALTAAVVRLADDEALCLRMSAAASARAADFTLEAFNRSIAQIVEAARG